MTVRLDVLVVERGLAANRSQAQSLILAGQVLVNGVPVTRAGARFPVGADLRLAGAPHPYVSRGGLKLAQALTELEVPVEGRVCLDVGASTGGFTDCLIRHGARRVFAVDVGYGQLAWKLRRDPRVVPLERVNARYLRVEQLGEPVELSCVDVSFISLELIWPALYGVMQPGGDVLSLVKPQFEAGRSQVKKGGVVKDPQVHRQVLERLVTAAPGQGLHVRGLTFCRFPGPSGNVEFWLYLRAGPGPQVRLEPATVVGAAHRWLRQEGRGPVEKS
ncbi:MAG TPA: TlyA family rRNA (cytidine-2'-O)-methyltransferase [Clostridiales bacterium UBA8153]|nr:TlyA family rRNA (cytidine-2'-O)-methyltransferase [Clostridiales bacterium UBA8153]